MVPLGVGDAASVLVGHAVGRADPEARRAIGAGGAALRQRRSCRARRSLFLTAPGILAGSTPVTLRLAVAASLIPLAGVFQVFDGLQVVAGGILRGLGETRVAMLVNMLGYWLLGLPVSYVLGFGRGGVRSVCGGGWCSGWESSRRSSSPGCESRSAVASRAS